MAKIEDGKIINLEPNCLKSIENECEEYKTIYKYILEDINRLSFMDLVKVYKLIRKLIAGQKL